MVHIYINVILYTSNIMDTVRDMDMQETVNYDATALTYW